MTSDLDWRAIIRRERDRFVQLAVPLAEAAVMVVVFLLLEGAILKLIDLVSTLVPFARVRPWIHIVIEEIAVWSVIGVTLFFAFYTAGEIIREFLRGFHDEAARTRISPLLETITKWRYREPITKEFVWTSQTLGFGVGGAAISSLLSKGGGIEAGVVTAPAFVVLVAILAAFLLMRFRKEAYPEES